jgi:shikimate kinase
MRPLLAAAAPGRPSDSVGRLQEVLALRRELYAEVALVRVSTEGRSPDQVADELLRLLRDRG